MQSITISLFNEVNLEVRLFWFMELSKYFCFLFFVQTFSLNDYCYLIWALALFHT